MIFSENSVYYPPPLHPAYLRNRSEITHNPRHPYPFNPIPYIPILALHTILPSHTCYL